MHVFEPMKVDDGWQMVYRALSGDKTPIPVTPVHPTSDQARNDPRSKKWRLYIEGRGEPAIEMLRWAHKKMEATPELEMGLPKEILEAYDKAGLAAGLAPKKK